MNLPPNAPILPGDMLLKPSPVENELPLAATPVHTRNYAAMARPEKDFRNRNLVRLLLSFARGRTLLDVGCGYGLLVAQAREAGFSAQGIEPDQDLIALGQSTFGPLPVAQGDATCLGEFGTFDTVVVADVLEAVADDQAVLRNAASVVAPGGRLILCVPALMSLFGSRDRAMGYYRRYGRKLTEQRMTALGLRVVNSRYWNALFVLPYYLAYCAFKQEVEYDSFRGGRQAGPLGGLVSRGLNGWFRGVENRCHFGFGLSLIVVGERSR